MMGEIISIAAAILSIYQFATKGNNLTMRLGSQPKFETWNGLKVF
jgi:hypothetical protein